MENYTEKDGKPLESLRFSEEELRTPEKSYVPEGFDTVEDYLKDVREEYELDIEFDADNRTAALEDKKFTAGDQWDPIVLEQRRGLPCLKINTIPQFTAQLVGDWRTNRSAVKVIPSENGDKDVAALRSDLIRSVEVNSRAQMAYDNAFESMVQCADGAFRIDVQYANEDVFDQDIVINPIDDALSVVWDRMSIDPTGRDARHCFVDDTMSRKDFEKRWPDHNPSSLSTREMKSMASSGWCDSGTVRVTEHWRIIERKRLLVMFEDGAVYPFPEDTDPAKIDEAYEKHGKIVRTRLAPCRYAQMHLVTGFAILAGPYEWKLNRLPIVRMSGRVVTLDGKRVRYGLVRYMKDPVRLRNFWRSIAAEQLGYSPKAQWLAPASAVEGREEDFRTAHLKRDPLLTYNDDATAPPMRIDPPAPQMALLNEAQVNTQDIKDVTGIHDASLGIKSNETSGRAIMARQREGDIASITYYDNGNAAIRECGDVVNQLISQIYDGTRIIRIIGEDESSRLVRINDPMDPNSPNLAFGKYDVTLTTGASYTTRRVEAAQAMMEAVQVFPQMMEIAGDLVAKAQDWPGAEELAERLRKTIPPQLLSEKERTEMGEQGPDMQQIMQQQAQVQEAMAQAQQELAQLKEENVSLKLKAEIEAKKLEIDEFKAESERLKIIAEIAAKDEEFNLRNLEREAQMENDASNREFRSKELEQSAKKDSTPSSTKAATETSKDA